MDWSRLIFGVFYLVYFSFDLLPTVTKDKDLELGMRRKLRLRMISVKTNEFDSSKAIKLVGGRDKPIIATLEFAKEYLMKRCDRPCTPTATKILKANLDEAKKYSVDWDGDEF
nr:hypothetical protein [Tanacetum cinerariifolium]